MKQPKRNFVIEYKSGRRRSVTTQANSIWGNLDLKSVARAVETDLPGQSLGIDGPAKDAVFSMHSEQHIVAETNAAKEIISPRDGELAVESIDLGAPVDNDAQIDAEAAVGATDVRSLAEGDATGEPARAKPSGAKHKLRRVRQAGAGAGRKPVKPMLAKPKPASFSEVDEELADLFQLEEENRQLRRLLVTKLREENAWLSERLQRR
ncbi:hypothetical protein JZX87_25770 [Agrobacterium sp. Ap1]|uniref:hypothetical protein n=1 Tax=Rhizobium/Agrobacterium group TaxID=227290 RepID=UPI001A8C4D93|nr:hypothetical protein [Agrobacterium sp. Ap1]MBO0144566.1 hypothetical protein [Agrobacterium sp. Ap1]